ncbi:MAG: acetyl-CoA carboxylase carboxyltransferase subunit alpha [Oligoflexia bacterium]|nr:acetyl-CoA carboxylase carboxyltransferase subunit alpha [Oligoflexia bacterium]
MEAFFEFEKPIVNLEKKLQDLRELAKAEGVDFAAEISKLEKKVSQLIDETYAKLTPWQKVQLSRHPSRPYTRDYVDILFPDFLELQGDRTFSDDQAILGGVALWPPVNPAQPEERGTERTPVLLLGHQKGRNTKQKMERNFGMAKPEGYRKAIRLMELAERSRMPIITFIDTPGAYPGMDAEERGQSQAIAESIHAMFKLSVPTAALVIGEGGSGGALALGCANVVLMQEYSVYSVISPESCASILWSDSSLAERASERLKMSPTELLRLGVIDAIVPEPKGGAHRDLNQAGQLIRDALIKQFDPLIKSRRKAGKKLMADRLEKFRKMGEIALDHAPI